MILTPEDYNHLAAIIGVLMFSQHPPREPLLNRLKGQCMLSEDLENLTDAVEEMRVGIERAVFTLEDTSERQAAIETIRWCARAEKALQYMLAAE